jgi:hypothetical protein
MNERAPVWQRRSALFLVCVDVVAISFLSNESTVVNALGRRAAYFSDVDVRFRDGGSDDFIK